MLTLIRAMHLKQLLWLSVFIAGVLIVLGGDSIIEWFWP